MLRRLSQCHTQISVLLYQRRSWFSSKWNQTTYKASNLISVGIDLCVKPALKIKLSIEWACNSLKCKANKQIERIANGNKEPTWPWGSISQTLAVWSTEPEASFVPVQFQATECTFDESNRQKMHRNRIILGCRGMTEKRKNIAWLRKWKWSIHREYIYIYLLLVTLILSAMEILKGNCFVHSLQLCLSQNLKSNFVELSVSPHC